MVAGVKAQTVAFLGAVCVGVGLTTGATHLWGRVLGAALAVGAASGWAWLESAVSFAKGQVDAAPIPKVLFKRDGRILTANDAAWQHLGATTSLYEALRAQFGDEVKALVERAATQGRGLNERIASIDGLTFELVVSSAKGLHTAALRDVTEEARTAARERLVSEGERVKTAVAWVLSIDAPLSERLTAGLASVFQLAELEDASTKAVLYGMSDHGTAPVLAWCGSFAGDVPPLEQALPSCSTVNSTRVVEHCECHGTPHGHYAVPLLERVGVGAGTLLVWVARPSHDEARLETLSHIGELFTTALVRDRAEQSLVEARRNAEEASRAKSDFLATMSHEIRTPMNGVLGFAQLLLESPGLSQEQHEHARLIVNSGEALLALINDVLDFSKIEAGKLVIDPRPTAVGTTAREVVELLRATAAKKDVALTVTVEPDVPSGLLLDSMRFRQVLLNLTGNAIKFTPRGQVKVRLCSVLDRGLKLLHVEVIDDGIGIPAHVLPTLFAKFVQAESSTSRRFGGTGLGLAISKHLVELMGGTIGASSQDGRGSTFWFRLPAHEVVIDQTSTRPAPRKPQALPLRVLLAEDNPVNQLLATKVLERIGAQVTLAANGAAAVDCFKREPFDVVLMDCHMPGVDGYEATRSIRELERTREQPRTPIVAVTASAFADEVQRCLEAGMDSVLTKPFKLTDLEQALARADGEPAPSFRRMSS